MRLVLRALPLIVTCSLVAACRCSDPAPSPPATPSPPALKVGRFPAGEFDFVVLSAAYTNDEGDLVAHVAAAGGEVRFVFEQGAQKIAARSGEGLGRVEIADAGASQALAEALLAQLRWTDRREPSPGRTYARTPIPFRWVAKDLNGHALLEVNNRERELLRRWDDARFYLNPLGEELGIAFGAANDASNPWLWHFAQDIAHGAPERLRVSSDPLLASNAPLLSVPEFTEELGPCRDGAAMEWSPAVLACASVDGLFVEAGTPFALARLAPISPFGKDTATAAMALALAGSRLLVEAHLERGGRRLAIVDVPTAHVAWTRPVPPKDLLAARWSSDLRRVLVRSEVHERHAALALLDAANGARVAHARFAKHWEPVREVDDGFVLADTTDTFPAKKANENAPEPTTLPPAITLPEEPVARLDDDGVLRPPVPTALWREKAPAVEPLAKPAMRPALPGACTLELDPVARTLLVDGRAITLRRAWAQQIAVTFTIPPTSALAWPFRLQWLGPCHVMLDDPLRREPVIVNLRTGRWQYLFPEGDALLHRVRDDGRQVLVITGARAGFVDVPEHLP